MRLSLTPREHAFYPLFTRAAENLVIAADLLAELVTAPADARAELAARVKDAENTGDDITHEIMIKVNTTFVTPFDREDIYRLASSLDDVIDAMEEAADDIVRYRLGELPPAVSQQVDVLQRAAAVTAAAMPRLRTMQQLSDYWIEVNSLEDEADRVYRGLLAEIFNNGGPVDVLMLLKLKEVVDRLEEAADAFETVANTVESIALKES
jgi:predicted phosphate transport protein (TIGR00153 family)